MTLLGLVVAAVIFSILVSRERARTRSRLREIDHGRRCISCNGTNLARTVDLARCLNCGHTVRLSSLQAAVVSAEEIENINRPDDREDLPEDDLELSDQRPNMT